MAVKPRRDLLLARGTSALLVQPEDASYRFRILDASAQNHGYGFFEGNELNFDDFVVFGLGCTRSKVAGEIDGHGLGHESGTGPEAEDALPLARGKACFF